MKKFVFPKWRSGFLHWKGWKAFCSFWIKAWHNTTYWAGWKILFGIPIPLLLLMSIGCAAGLAWVFLNAMELQILAYVLYALSAYCVTALCVQLPSAVQSGLQWLSDHPRISGLLHNEELQFKLGLYFQQIVNFSYGIFKITSGIFIGSAWVGCDGIYNMSQALIQLFQILRRKKCGTLNQQWKSYRICGVLILLMHLTLIGIVFQMVNWNRYEEQGQIMVIATAAFAFYKFINSFIVLAKDRKHTHPVDSSVRMLELSQAIFAIFSLQASMIHTFGTGEFWEYWLNLGTGSAVCLLTVCIGIYMIRRGNRELKKLQENMNGE